MKIATTMMEEDQECLMKKLECLMKKRECLKMECLMKKPFATEKKMRLVFSPSWNDISFSPIKKRRRNNFTQPVCNWNIGGIYWVPPTFPRTDSYSQGKGQMGQFPTHQFPNDKRQESLWSSHHRPATQL